MKIQGEKLRKLFDVYLKHSVLINETEKTQKKKREFAQRFLRVIGNKEYTAKNIMDYLNILKKDGCNPNKKRSKPWSNGGIITEVRTLRAFTNWLFEFDHIPKSFAKQIIKPKYDYVPKDMISLEEAYRVVGLSNKIEPTDSELEKNRKIERKFTLKALLLTAVRISELKSVRGKGLQLNVKDPYMEMRRKGGKWDKVVIKHEELISELKKRTSWDYVFPANLDGVSKSWKKALKETGHSENIPLHRFRHMTVTETIDNGASILHVQKILAHKDVGVTTNIYYQNSVKAKLETQELFNPLWRKQAPVERMIEYLQIQIERSGLLEDKRFKTKTYLNKKTMSFHVELKEI